MKPLETGCFNRLWPCFFHAACRGLVYGGVHASHLPHHLEEFPRSASGWTASASTQEVQDGGDSLFLNTTQTTSDRRVSECVLLCNQQKFCTWYQVVWHGSYEFIHIHTLHAMQLCISFLVNCKKKCCIIYQTCKKKQCFDQFMPKTDTFNWLPSSIYSRLSSVAMVASGIIRESSFASPKTRVFFWFFWSWKIPKFEKFCYISWMSWKSILMKYNLKSVVNGWYSLARLLVWWWQKVSRFPYRFMEKISCLLSRLFLCFSNKALGQASRIGWKRSY